MVVEVFRINKLLQLVKPLLLCGQSRVPLRAFHLNRILALVESVNVLYSVVRYFVFF